MGRILQIRVSAWTYDEDEVLAAWPKLCAAVWPELDKWAPVGNKHGVIELAEALPDVLRFGKWSKELKADCADAVRVIDEIRERIEKALSDWKPEDANHASDELEAALNELEKIMPEPEKEED